MAASKRILVRLESEAGTGSFYTTSFNPSNAGPDKNKLRMKKYDPKSKKHEWFKQTSSIAGKKKK